MFIGIGVNPNLCNCGYGNTILLLAYEISKELYPSKPLYLEVRTWNKRAIRCYEKSGFKIEGKSFEQTTSLGKAELYRMVKK